MITITLKGIPKDVHQALKKRAATHGRSLNTEAIAVLKASVLSQPVDTQALLTRVRTLRAAMKFDLKGKPLDVVKMIREDRDSH